MPRRSLPDRARTVLARSLAGLILVALVGTLAGSRAVAAQDATPGATPDVPPPSECLVEPVDPSALLPLLSGGGQASPLLTASPTPPEALPQGPPATRAEVAAITAAVRELVACANLQDPLRLVALLTDDFKGALAVAALQVGEEGAEELVGRFPVPIGNVDPNRPVEMIPIRDARLLPDGNVGAILEPTVAGVEARPIFFVVFEPVGDRWLVDDVVLVDTGIPVTPVG